MVIKTSKIRKESRKKEALELFEKRSLRSDEEQLKLLDEKFGKDLGAKKERAKLIKRIEEKSLLTPKETLPSVPETTDTEPKKKKNRK